MSKIKRALALLMALLMAASAAACGTADDNADDYVKGNNPGKELGQQAVCGRTAGDGAAGGDEQDVFHVRRHLSLRVWVAPLYHRRRAG